MRTCEKKKAKVDAELRTPRTRGDIRNEYMQRTRRDIRNEYMQRTRTRGHEGRHSI